MKVGISGFFRKSWDILEAYLGFLQNYSWQHWKQNNVYTKNVVIWSTIYDLVLKNSSNIHNFTCQNWYRSNGNKLLCDFKTVAI